MNAESLRELLDAVRQGRTSIEDAIGRLRDLPYEDLGYARLDHHRALRTGYPEAVFCQGKTPAQVAEIIQKLSGRHPRVIGTRASEDAARATIAAVPGARYHPLPRMIVVDRAAEADPLGDRAAELAPASAKEKGGQSDPPFIVVCSGGTSDLPVAEEAALTAEILGTRVVRLWDVGVAGIHRLIEHRGVIAEARAIVAVAGMEGALPGIVAGLAACPVIAVPTSIGYGANLGGLAALLTMVNSCAPGVAVVNIDNGFGAGYTAHMIARVATSRSPVSPAGPRES
jgi:pyridinium-3,5-biscarboxylic acid mononucleotide synthase